jgi:hypothetical protein
VAPARPAGCDGNLLVQGKHDALGVDMMRHSLRRYG